MTKPNIDLQCHLCGSKNLVRKSGVEDFEFGVPCEKPLFACKTCDVIAIYPLPAAEEVKSFYQGYHVYEDKRPPLIRSLVNIFNYFQRRDFMKRTRLSSGRVLEIGCATGSFLSSLKDHGNFECWGIDIGEEAIVECRKKGITAYVGTLESTSLPKNFFDVIIMNNLIEHVQDPKDLLKRCFEHLKPGGTIYGETPTSRCGGYYLWGKYWFGYHYPRHLFIFCQKNLLRLASSVGFKNSRCYSIIHPGTWAVSAENFINDLLPWPLKRNRGRTILGAPLMILFVPLNILEVVFNFSGAIRFIFEKPISSESLKQGLNHEATTANQPVML